MRNQINFIYVGTVSGFIPEPIGILGWKLEKKKLESIIKGNSVNQNLLCVYHETNFVINAVTIVIK